MKQNDWWRGAVIYQIYPRSLKDTNGDGIGDLRGIIQKLDYIAELGVDAIWISPFFKSPMKDFGYDISNYRDIDPIFGNLQDFEQLIEKAHKLEIKVIIDQVLSHTSEEHPWFLDSKQDLENTKSDWYVWADAKDDGTPPNNWLSIFGGGAWQWEPRRKQYYLHNFLPSQPDLNFHNPEVRQATLDNIEFWLKKGVDGFRLDAINFCFHDALLRDNPAKPVAERQGRGFSEDNPYAFQYHYYNNTQPENIKFIESIRKLLDRYPGTAALGEISSEDSLATMAEYTQSNSRLHMGYSFELLTDDYSAEYIKRTVINLEDKMKDGWPCWAISNHDVERVVSRWGGGRNIEAKSKLFSAMLMSLRGSVCSYQGEELGLCEAVIEYQYLQDPYGINFWPSYKGRDGCRTPLPWNDSEENAGFSNSKPWLPIPKLHLDKNVDKQISDVNSVLNSFKTFVKWRKNTPQIITGDFESIEAPDDVLAFKRSDGEKSIVLYFNLSEKVSEIEIDSSNKMIPIVEHGINTGAIEEKKIVIPALGCFIAEIIK